MAAVIPIRSVEPADLDAYLQHLVRHDEASGRNGELPYGPYERLDVLPLDERRQRTTERLARGLDEPNWRRVWAAFDGDRCVGQLALTGGGLKTDLHRANLGVGIELPYRRRGLATRLMDVALAWARAEPSLSWIDLGVFGGNDIAQRMYERLDFGVMGRIPDRFRVDGVFVEEILMTLRVDGS